jgi:hypothetical protein
MKTVPIRGFCTGSHRQLLRYEKDGPELYWFAQNNNILKDNLCKKMRLRALKSIQSFPIS